MEEHKERIKQRELERNNERQQLHKKSSWSERGKSNRVERSHGRQRSKSREKWRY